MLDYAAVGRRIRALRKAKNLSQEQLAEQIWISTTHMSHIETGTTKLSLPVLVDLAIALEVGTDEILDIGFGGQKKKSAQTVNEILADCTVRQVRVIEEIVRSAKRAMDENL